jgi:hypothetical protein
VAQFVAPTASHGKLQQAIRIDKELLKCSFFEVKKPKPFSCTLQDELKEPVYR